MKRPIPDPQRRYTVEEYFAIDESSDVKYEYRDGYISPHVGWEADATSKDVAGCTAEHSDIACNLLVFLSNSLRGTSSKAVGCGMRVRSPHPDRYHYPDVCVTCEPRLFNPPDQRVTLINPSVIVEVSSPSTADFDFTDKRTDYFRIESLQQYLLVQENRPRVESFGRHPDGSWATIQSAVGMESTIAVPSLGIELPLAEVYAGVPFPPRRHKAADDIGG